MSARVRVASLTALPRRALVTGVLALVGCAIGGILAPTSFFAAWLTSWLFVLGIALAGMATVMIHELTGGRWGRIVRPPLEAAMATLPVVALLGVPLAFGLDALFPWARDPGVEAARAWLNAPSFLVRNALWLATWSALAWRLRSLLARDPAPAVLGARRRTAITGLAVYLVTVTLAAYDWVAALVPGWASTAVGIRLGASQFVATLAFALVFALATTHARASAASEAREFQDLGNLLLTFAMTWAYFAFSQYVIVWADDLPRETAWYLPRATTSWRALVFPVIALNFAVPTVAMLFRAVKRARGGLGVVAALALVGAWLDVMWLTLPSLRPHGFALTLLDLIAPVAVGGLWLASVGLLVPRERAAAVTPGARA